jgi:hypothetical protein
MKKTLAILMMLATTSHGVLTGGSLTRNSQITEPSDVTALSNTLAAADADIQGQLDDAVPGIATNAAWIAANSNLVNNAVQNSGTGDDILIDNELGDIEISTFGNLTLSPYGSLTISPYLGNAIVSSGDLTVSNSIFEGGVAVDNRIEADARYATISAVSTNAAWIAVNSNLVNNAVQTTTTGSKTITATAQLSLHSQGSDLLLRSQEGIGWVDIDAEGVDMQGTTLYRPADPSGSNAGQHVGDRDYNDGRYGAIADVASNTSYIAANSNLVAGAVQNVSGSAPSSVSIYGPDLVSIASQLEVTLTSLDDINFLSGGTLYLGADTAVNFQVSRLTNIADPSSPNDLADLGYNDARYYNSSGETKLVLTGGYITISNGAFYIYTN